MPSQPKSKILLGVTGGIAAYKACELVRLFKRAGHDVRVIMTAHAEQFVGAMTFESLSGSKVLRSLSQGVDDLSATSHIDLAVWGDLLVVAPATANFLAKYAAGVADDALLTESLAFQGPILIAPAMNSRMWQAQVTRENCQRITERGVHFIGPISGDLACGETGEGKMSEPADILARAQELLSEKIHLKGKKVLVTSGPTRSYIDPIRYITNRSSGRMGHAIASVAERLGAQVTLVTGPVEDKFSKLLYGSVIKVETSQQMARALQEIFNQHDWIFAAAAVSDFETKTVSPKKIPRTGSLSLSLEAAPDVIGQVSKHRRPDQVIVGFAAELGEGAEEFAKARDKIERKGLDFLAFNNVSRTDIGFDSENNEIILFAKNKQEVDRWPKMSKVKVAEKILSLVSQFHESR